MDEVIIKVSEEICIHSEEICIHSGSMSRIFVYTVDVKLLAIFEYSSKSDAQKSIAPYFVSGYR